MIWLNGKLVDPDTPVIRGSDRGFLLGDGIFETILVIDGRGCFFEAHMKRLRAAAEFLDIKIPYSDSDLGETIRELYQNYPKGYERAALRLTVTRGAGPRGLLPSAFDHQTPTVMMALAPSPARDTHRQGSIAAASAPPLRAMISTLIRCEKNPTSGMKTLGYLDNQLAKLEASTAGAQEAVMLNSQGEVACSSIGNLFLITAKGELVTPPLASGALPGITRRFVMMCAPLCGLPVIEEPVLPKYLRENFVFMTNSLMGLRRLTFQTEAGQGSRTAHQHLFRALYQAYEEQVLADLGE